jgi:hypothetical protein
MTDITEVKTGAAPTTDLICPLMSGQLAPSNPGPGDIAPPGVMILKPTIVVCVREKCGWWDEFGHQCAIEAIAEGLVVVSGSLSSVRDVLEPATKSPLATIANKLSLILDTLDKRDPF